MFDERDPVTGQVIRPGTIDRMPDMDAMRRDIFSIGITNPQHYETMKEVFDKYGVILDPHGAVGWKTLEIYLNGQHNQPAVIYETADPGKFPIDVQKAIGLTPELPPKMKRQAGQKERIYHIEGQPEHTGEGLKLSHAQIKEAEEKIKEIFK
jgi:threonine synthase